MPEPLVDARPTLVFDTSVLSCFARARRLDTLRRLTEGYRRVVTTAVLDEMLLGVVSDPVLAEVSDVGWLERARIDGLNELMIFSDYVRLLDIGKRDVGEAATLTWAEIHGAVAVVDDQTAVDVARTRGVQVRRTLAFIAAGIQNGLFDHPDAIRLVDDLRRGGGRFPCEGRDFIAWARFNDLLS